MRSKWKNTRNDGEEANKGWTGVKESRSPPTTMCQDEIKIWTIGATPLQARGRRGLRVAYAG